MIMNANICTPRSIFAHMNIPWSDIPFFLALAHGKSLSAAAKSLKMDRTTVSRRLSSFEGKLKEPVFERTNNQFVMTKFGRQLFTIVECAEQDLSGLLAPEASPLSRGRIRISISPPLFMALKSCFTHFMVNQPKILLEFSTTDRQVDLTHYEADIAIRFGSEPQRHLKWKKISTPTFSLYQSCAASYNELPYISRPGEVEPPGYIAQHLPSTKVAGSVDGFISLRELIKENVGIGLLPTYFGDQDDSIKRCSPTFSFPDFSLYIVYLPEQQRLNRIQKFVKYINNHFSSQPNFFNAEAPHNSADTNNLVIERT